ncbi:hypothetical protein ACQCWA_20830 [Rossellomorea aquimaris]|uniref:hypothetical protein n=1 Tax=Rossellomorea aquimaris TaxID=189382 RepID=UPI003CF62530
MLSEDYVTYYIMKELKRHGWEIVQYHPPGGQASFGVYILEKLIYLDIIAFKESDILIFENKSRYDVGDIMKLQLLLKDTKALLQITDYINNYCEIHNLPLIKGGIINGVHGYSGKRRSNALEDIHLVNVGSNGDLFLLNSTTGIISF